MILRRIAAALKRQDWATVLIEFVLVIFGVLIALQVNNWNEARLERQEEVRYLTALADELDHNIERLEMLIALNNQYLDSVDYLLRMTVHSLDDVDHDAVSDAFATTMLLNETVLNSGVYDELVSSGKLQILGSLELKAKLNDYHRQIKNVARIEQIDVRNWNETYTPFLEQHFNMQPIMLAWANGDEDYDLTQVMDWQSDLWDRPLTDPEKRKFANILVRRHSAKHFSRFAQYSMLERSRALRGEIINELERR